MLQPKGNRQRRLRRASTMARNNLDMLSVTATAFGRVTGEVPRTLIDLASADRRPSEPKPLWAIDTLFVNKLKDSKRYAQVPPPPNN